MKLKLQQIVTTAYATLNLAPETSPSEKELAEVRELIRKVTEKNLNDWEVEILLMAERIADKYEYVSCSHASGSEP